MENNFEINQAELDKLRKARRNSRIKGILIILLGYVIMFATAGMESISFMIFGALIAFVGIVILIRTFFNYKYAPLNFSKKKK